MQLLLFYRDGTLITAEGGVMPTFSRAEKMPTEFRRSLKYSL